MSQRQTLEGWIREALTDEDKEHKCTAIALVHKAGIADVDVHTIRLGAREITPKQMADLFQGKANSFAQDFGGTQTFNLLAFYGNDQPEARHPFLVYPTSASEALGLATETPDEKGMRQQGMRLTEAIVNGTFRMQGTVHNSAMQMLDSATRQNATLMAEVQRLQTMVQTLLVERDQRTHEYRMKELEYERQTQMRNQLMSHVPGVVNSLAGKQIFPQTNGDSFLIEALADNLNDEGLQALTKCLPPHDMAALANRMASHVEKKQVTKVPEAAE